MPGTQKGFFWYRGLLGSHARATLSLKKIDRDMQERPFWDLAETHNGLDKQRLSEQEHFIAGAHLEFFLFLQTQLF